MKHLVLLLALSFLAACGSLKKTQSGNPTAGTEDVQGNPGSTAAESNNTQPAAAASNEIRTNEFSDNTRVLGIMNYLASDD